MIAKDAPKYWVGVVGMRPFYWTTRFGYARNMYLLLKWMGYNVDTNAEWDFTN